MDDNRPHAAVEEMIGEAEARTAREKRGFKKIAIVTAAVAGE